MRQNQQKQKPRNGEPETWNDRFRRVARVCADALGTPAAFLSAIGIIVIWAATGPIFNYSDTWQLIINTGTTIITFLMVFLIQNTQNRDSKSIHLKLDELIRSVNGARNSIIDLDNLSDGQLKALEESYKRLCSEPDTLPEPDEKTPVRRGRAKAIAHTSPN